MYTQSDHQLMHQQILLPVLYPSAPQNIHCRQSQSVTEQLVSWVSIERSPVISAN